MNATREQLRRKGIRLAGPVVPEWFKELADGCSVPRGLRWIMRARHGRASCYIHDWRYYCAAIANPKGDIRAQNRMLADYELKQNRAASMRWRPVGWVFGSLYFRGVRVGGAYTMRDRVELMDRVPPTPNDTDRLYAHLKQWYSSRDDERVVSIMVEMREHMKGGDDE